jgi:hypothetical protein
MRQHQVQSLQSHDAILRTLGDQLAKLAYRSTALEKSERILESLYCEEVHRRELGVSEAESCTFSWAFDSWCIGHCFTFGRSCPQIDDDVKRNLKSNGRCWPHDEVLEPPFLANKCRQKHFLNWLERDTKDPFMITGKPGSGKSTFMKFVAGHKQTRIALDTWSGGRKLVVASFYFWSPGTPLQRSQDGLLRCLLYKILSQMPDMIPVAVPRRWQAADQLRIAEPWPRKEISDAFANVVNANSLSTNFCFFIDGLDEYGGSDLGSGETDLDLVLQLKTLSSSPCVKLCISSRPRNIFGVHFPAGGPRHITLQDHTTKDIEQLVESRVDRVQGLISIDHTDLEKFKHMIAERSSGVFLWVVLVVRELLDGLESPFSLPEMEQRLLMLPATLDGYFQKILDNVHQQYRRFSARLLLLSVHRHQPPLCYVYVLWLLEQEEFDSGGHAANAAERQRNFFWESDTSSRINKICGDFLIVKGHSRGWYIEHNHRSVVDFLLLPAVKEELLALAGWHTESDVYLMLCRLFVSCCEENLIEVTNHGEFEDFAGDVEIYERSSGTTCADLIYNLDRALCSQPPPTGWLQRFWVDRLIHCCHEKWRICKAHALLLLASFYCLKLFVEQEIEALSMEAQIPILNDILKALVLGCYHQFTYTEGNCTTKTVELLCSKGANVNSIARATIIPMIEGSDINTESPRLVVTHTDETDLGMNPQHSTNKLADCTIWEFYLLERNFQQIHAADTPDPVKLAVVLIEAGADLKCRLPEDCNDVEEAIVKRVEAEMVERDDDTHEPLKSAWRAVGDKNGYPMPITLTDVELRPIRAALARRGFTVRDSDIDWPLKDARTNLSDEDFSTDQDSDADEHLEDARIDLSNEGVDPIRVALVGQVITDRDSDTDEPMVNARTDLSDEDWVTDPDSDTDAPMVDA